jgi:hypothetical protein
MSTCLFCYRIFDSHLSLRSHIPWCGKNPQKTRNNQQLVYMRGKRQPKSSKYEKINWNEIQLFYDSGKSHKEIINNYKISNHSILWAVKQQKLKSRTHSESIKNCWKVGKIKKEMFQNLKRKNHCLRITRSKNEILFAESCKQYFGENKILENKKVFNGWDADVIIPHLKIAVLWNGIWHYKQISKATSLEQIQNRDKIKIKEIKSCGYFPYIIKDMGKFNEEFVNLKFQKFIGYVAQIARATVS